MQITTEAKNAILNCLANAAYANNNAQALYDALANAFFPIESITAVYTQGSTVYDTDTLDSLRDDLVVTANYEGGASETVTTYTLSGTLTAGTSTIVATYGGKSASFNVTVSASNYFTGATKCKGYYASNKLSVFNIDTTTTGSKNTMAYCLIEPNATYRITKALSDSFRVDLLTVEPVPPTSLTGKNEYSVSQTVADHSGTEMTVTATNETYLMIHYYNGSSSYNEGTIYSSIAVVKV